VPIGDATGSETHVLDQPTAGGKVIRGTLLRVISYGAGVLLGVLSAALLTRHLGAADFGRYITVVSLIAVAAGLSDAGLLNVGVREYSVRERGERERLLSNLFGIRLAVTAIGTLLAVAFAIAAGYGTEMVLGTALAGLALLVTTFQQTLAVPLSSDLRLGWVSSLEFIRQLATLVAVAALVFAGAGLLAFLAAQIPVALVVLLATVVLVHRLVSVRPAFALEQWKRLTGVVLPYAAANAVGVLYGSLAVILLSLISTADETGYFGAAFRVFLVIAGIPALLVTSAFPILARAARDDHERLAYACQRLWDISLLVGSGLALATLIGAPLAIDIVAGKQFEPSVDVLRVQAAALLPSFVFGVWGFALLALARYRGLLIANGVALLASAALTLGLGSAYGAFGAAFATLVGDTCLAIGYAIVLMRGHPEFRVSLELVPRVAVACGVAACSVLLPLPVVLQLTLTVVAYVAVVFALKAVPEEIPEALGLRREAR
jgi:O-antigen/teichoic acid export membrane protein